MTISVITEMDRSNRAVDVQQLRETAIELQRRFEKGLAKLEKQRNVMIDDLLWWTVALKAASER